MLATEVGLDLDLGGDPLWVQRAIGALAIPAVGAGVVAGAWFGLQGSRSSLLGAAIAIAGATLLAGASPQAWDSWTKERFGPQTQARFAPWRAIISPDAEVFWPDQLQATWFALGRRSYLSKSQLGGIVFSAETTAEARRRAQALAAVFPPGQWFNETAGIDHTRWAKSIAEVRAACDAPDLAFVVTNANFGKDVPPLEWPTPGRRVYLFDCIELRRGAS